MTSMASPFATISMTQFSASVGSEMSVFMVCRNVLEEGLTWLLAGPANRIGAKKIIKWDRMEAVLFWKFTYGVYFFTPFWAIGSGMDFLEIKKAPIPIGAALKMMQGV